MTDEEICAVIRDSGLPIEIQVDGGITAENADIPASCGANNFVAGSAVFRANDYSAAIAAIRDRAAAAYR